MKITTKINDFAALAEKCGFSENETLEDYVSDVLCAIKKLDYVDDNAVVFSYENRGYNRDCILEEIYIELITKHTRYLNSKLNTIGMKWDCKCGTYNGITEVKVVRVK